MSNTLYPGFLGSLVGDAVAMPVQWYYNTLALDRDYGSIDGHRRDFSAGVCANASVGGDNCHRGVVVGSILGTIHGVPDDWVNGLHPSPPVTAPQT
jgi:ADP-ribosylglycohydrolase